MAGYIYGSTATGISGIYAQIRSMILGTIANGVALEAYNQAHWSNYVVSAAEDAGSGEYKITVPGYLPAGRYKATFYNPIGGSPASGDTPFATEYFDWDGTNVSNVGSALNIGSINGSSTAAVLLALSANAMASGAAATGTLTTSQMTTNLTGAEANLYAGRTLIFTSGINAGLAVLITAYAVTGGKITFIAYNSQPAPAAPSNGDGFVIL